MQILHVGYRKWCEPMIEKVVAVAAAAVKRKDTGIHRESKEGEEQEQHADGRNDDGKYRREFCYFVEALNSIYVWGIPLILLRSTAHW